MENAVPPDRLTLDYPDAELVFGIVCAVGTDYRRVVDYLANLLKRAKYVPKEFHVSESFPEIASRPQWKVGEKSERIREPEPMTKTAGSSSGDADSEG